MLTSLRLTGRDGDVFSLHRFAAVPEVPRRQRRPGDGVARGSADADGVGGRDAVVVETLESSEVDAEVVVVEDSIATSLPSSGGAFDCVQNKRMNYVLEAEEVTALLLLLLVMLLLWWWLWK